jgi:hypothetical protein
MSLKLQMATDPPPASSHPKTDGEIENAKILCPHCQRTATNGVKCQGICVADSDY